MRTHNVSPSVRSLSSVIAIVFVSVCLSHSVLACGNVNGSGAIDLSDVSAAVSYLSGGGYIIGNPGQADMDNHYLYTMMDMALLVDIISGHPNAGVCPPALGPLDPPVSSNDYVSYDKTVMLANQSYMSLNLGFGLSDTSDFWYFPVKILVDGEVPVIDSAKSTISPQGSTFSDGKVTFRDWGVAFPSATHPGMVHPLGTIYFHVSPTASDRPVSISFDSNGPTVDTFKVNTPMVITTWPERSPKTPTFKYCCTGGRGNVNMSGIVDLSDLSLLASYLTLPGVALPCEDQANVNGTGIIDLADLTLMVQYLTSSGVTLPQCP